MKNQEKNFPKIYHGIQNERSDLKEHKKIHDQYWFNERHLVVVFGLMMNYYI